MTGSSASSPWSSPETVAGFAQSGPNAVLMRFSEEVQRRGSGRLLVDVGCGAARNAVPLAEQGWRVAGIDNSLPMLTAAVARARAQGVATRTLFAAGAMDALPVASASADVIVVHGIWNLATSGGQFRRAVGEAARVAKPGAAVFVFTFSRHTLPPSAQPVDGERFVFTQFSGRPQVFLTAEQLAGEMASAGFRPDPAVPLTEYNRPVPGALRAGSAPVIYEAAYRFRG
jgi:ubiquinone/menaquinone biosynthesis C-methylase UbiE